MQSLLERKKENPGVFLNEKLKRQSEIRVPVKKDTKKQEKIENHEKNIFLLELKKTESGHIDFNEELEDMIDLRHEISETRENLLAELTKQQEKNEELKKILKNKHEYNEILDSK